MKWIKIDKEKLGSPLYVTPNYDNEEKRSCIDYCYGIPELDNVLAESGKSFSAMNVELGILVYEDILMFILVRGTEAKGHFSIERNKIIAVNVKHGQMLNIRKDPGIDGGAMASKLFGIFGAIAAITVDIIKSKKKSKPVTGSLFEIVLDSKVNGENEKIVFACTDKNKERIEKVCRNIIKLST